MHKRHFGKDSNVLVIQAGGPLLNPTLPQDQLDRQREEDPLAARSEQDALFRDELRQFLDDLLIDRAIEVGCLSRPRSLDCEHVAFVDPSGGRKDSMTLAIAHQSARGRVVLDKLYVHPAPFDPDEAVKRCAEVLSAYGLSSVMGDAYAGEWPPSAFRKHGITYVPSIEDKSAIYNACLPLFTSNRVELLDAPVLTTELRLLEARTRPGGRADAVNHPPNGHDDAANSVCGALWRASHQLPSRPGIGSGNVTQTRHDYDPLNDSDRQQRDDPRPSYARPILYLND
jgi:hypothetical protein